MLLYLFDPTDQIVLEQESIGSFMYLCIDLIVNDLREE